MTARLPTIVYNDNDDYHYKDFDDDNNIDGNVNDLVIVRANK